MRTAYKVWSGIAAGVFCLVAATDLAAAGADPQDPVLPAAAPIAPRAGDRPDPADPPALPAGATESPVAGDTAVVARVLDGDTFETSDGRTVQVLAVDACELGTYGGERAADDARLQLEGTTVTLAREPGVDTDRHGYDLRVVHLPGGRDFGASAVLSDHTAVYDGHGAPARYLDELAERDLGDQVCQEPEQYGSGGDGDVDVDWPSPGDQGLPDGALTGGYCARKWWC